MFLKISGRAIAELPSFIRILLLCKLNENIVGYYYASDNGAELTDEKGVSKHCGFNESFS